MGFAAAVGQWQHVAVVLQQDLRRADRLAGEVAVLRAADGSGEAAVGEGPLEQAELELLRQDAAIGVVDARHRHPIGLDLGAQQVHELLVVVGHHDHVQPGVDRAAHLIGGEALLPSILSIACRSDTTNPVKSSSPLRTPLIR